MTRIGLIIASIIQGATTLKNKQAEELFYGFGLWLFMITPVWLILKKRK